jgi:hypothetical protein
LEPPRCCLFHAAEQIPTRCDLRDRVEVPLWPSFANAHQSTQPSKHDTFGGHLSHPTSATMAHLPRHAGPTGNKLLPTHTSAAPVSLPPYRLRLPVSFVQTILSRARRSRTRCTASPAHPSLLNPVYTWGRCDEHHRAAHTSVRLRGIACKNLRTRSSAATCPPHVTQIKKQERFGGEESGRRTGRQVRN